MLLYRFVPKNPLDFLLPNKMARSSVRTMDLQAESFLRLLQVHRQSTCGEWAIALHGRLLIPVDVTWLNNLPWVDWIT